MTEKNIKILLENLRLGIYDSDHYNISAEYYKYKNQEPIASVEIVDKVSNLCLRVSTVCERKSKTISYSTYNNGIVCSSQNNVNIISDDLYNSLVSYAIEKSTADVLLRDYQCIDTFKLSE